MKTTSIFTAFSAILLSASAQVIDLGFASTFGALSGAGVTNTGGTVITGDLGTTSTSITGFPPGVVTGTIHRNDNVTTLAFADYAKAFTHGQSLVATVNKAGRTTLGGENLVAGVYKYDTGLGLEGTLTLNGNGSGTGVWVFQCATTLITSSYSNMNLVGGAKASNVFWIVGSSATLGTYSSFVGQVLAQASVVANTGAAVKGALYAGAGIALDSNPVVVQTSIVSKVATVFRA
jgi:hypothetical protein